MHLAMEARRRSIMQHVAHALEEVDERVSYGCESSLLHAQLNQALGDCIDWSSSRKFQALGLLLQQSTAYASHQTSDAWPGEGHHARIVEARHHMRLHCRIRYLPRHLAIAMRNLPTRLERISRCPRKIPANITVGLSAVGAGHRPEAVSSVVLMKPRA
jgi:hypothetical protein